MKEKIKNLNKKTKIMIIFFVALIPIVSVAGIILYSKEVNNKVLQTQVAYWGLVIPSAVDYNEEEKTELQQLLDSREFMFNNLYFTDLQNLQKDFDLLHQKVASRIDTDKKYLGKKKQAEAINILAGASVAEQDIFNTRKAELLKLIEERKPFDSIDAAIKILKQTNDDIQKRIDTDRANSNQGGNWSSGSDWNSNRDNGSSSGGSNSGGSNSGSGSGSSSGGNSGGCITEPDGSQTCPWTPPF